jgi:hypothetical protein
LIPGLLGIFCQKKKLDVACLGQKGLKRDSGEKKNLLKGTKKLNSLFFRFLISYVG